jgi:hypothetical protein
VLNRNLGCDSELSLQQVETKGEGGRGGDMDGNAMLGWVG